MKQTIHYKPFEVLTVPLKGSNLIEASAGTGKTYSIAILVLRLIIEEGIPAEKILMVTFTKAAVAELQSRVTSFIRKAYNVAGKLEAQVRKSDITIERFVENTQEITGKKKKDNIEEIIRNALRESDAETTRGRLGRIVERLRNAMLLLDDISVQTIHGFCQHTLNEFSFETGQLSGMEMLTDISPLTEDELNKFWRKHITTLDIRLLEQLPAPLLKTELYKIISTHLSGKKYLPYREDRDYDLSAEWQAAGIERIENGKALLTELEQEAEQYLSANREVVRTICESSSYAQKSLLPCINDSRSFINALIEKRTTGYAQKLPEPLLTLADRLPTAREQLKETVSDIRTDIYCMGIRTVCTGISRAKQQSNLQGYDDLIGNLHRALVQKENPALVAALQQKYSTVFVDEFQDTDREQYEIFRTAFGAGRISTGTTGAETMDTNTVMFLIGDPKQSIYAWRKADIFTYFEARNSVSEVYGMNENHRSSEPLIHAMNRFFLPDESVDTFHFGDSPDAIRYIEVDSPADNSKGIFCYKGKPDVPISVFCYDKKESIGEAVPGLVNELLTGESYTILEKGRHTRISPSDIGILVRTNGEGRMIKNLLARENIPAVTIDDSKVLQSDEARSLLYLMEAIETPARGLINRALLTPLTGLRDEDLLQLDDEYVLGLFAGYKERWAKDGIYTALNDFVSGFGVHRALLGNHTENGERIIANLFQLIELVNQVQNFRNFSSTELISWLQRGINGMETRGDEFEIRMESDETAVKIITIHKSKGLQYPVVIAPYLDLCVETRDFLNFRHPATGEYVHIESRKASEEAQSWYQQQSEQENRRLLYVAITRAANRCYLFHNEKRKDSSLAFFLQKINENRIDPACIRISEGPQFNPAPFISAESGLTEAKMPEISFNLSGQNWRKLSYTLLAAQGEKTPAARNIRPEDKYDHFIFRTLKPGMYSGNMLHHLLEHLGDFTRGNTWERMVINTLRLYAPGREEAFAGPLMILLDHVMHAPVTINGSSFSLSQTDPGRQISELEFDFPVPLFSLAELEQFSNEETRILVRSFGAQTRMEGIMNGRMDLFFEHEGRYYILDWKSNYLGGTTGDYSREHLSRAMEEHNYHLQYLIYTVAAVKFLESRLAGFDYETQFGGIIYMFIRGIRKNGDTGIFTTRPPEERITELRRMIS